MNVYFVVGFANAMHRLPRFGGVTEMPLFSDTIDHGSTNGRYHACGIHRALSVTVDRNENPTQKSITRARYDVCLTRVDCQRAWAFSTRWYGWLFMSRAVHVTVVSHTLNKTRAFLETKNPARGLRRRGALSNTH